MDSRIKKNRIIKMIEKYDKKILKYYLDNGPYELKKKLDVGNEEIWKIIFDYLVYEKDAVKICVKKNSEYVRDIFINKGPKALRKSFYLDSPEYDDIWQYIMDYIGIASGAIYVYVNKNASYYQNLIRNGKASQIRKSLELQKPKYDSVWEDILDILLECISFTNFTHCQFEQGIRFFTNLYNSGRKHRSLNPREVKS
ncbi:hypothetical protein ACFLZH_03635 [Patescibacteria group bacterium]